MSWFTFEIRTKWQEQGLKCLFTINSYAMYLCSAWTIVSIFKETTSLLGELQCTTMY